MNKMQLNIKICLVQSQIDFARRSGNSTAELEKELSELQSQLAVSNQLSDDECKCGGCK